MPFHATVNIDNQQLDLFEAKAQSQEELIYNLFCEKKMPMSWSEVQGCFQWMDEVTIKARMTDLSKEKNAIKKKRSFRLMKDLTNKTISSKGAPCYRYRLIEINNLIIV
jgi:hypothetical protein